MFPLFSFPFGFFFFLSCQRAHVCVSSAVVQLVPAPCRDLTARAARSFILKGPWGWMPAAWDAVWWKWVSTRRKNISLALWDRGRGLCFFPVTISHWYSLSPITVKKGCASAFSLRCKRNSMTQLSAPVELPKRDKFGMWHLKRNISIDVLKYSLIHTGFTCL